MDPLAKTGVGNTGLKVTRLGQGGAPIGGLYSKVNEQDAISTYKRGVDLGLTLFDTAPHYGLGKSEYLVGKALGVFSRDSFVLSTKVGKLLLSDEKPTTEKHWVDLPPLGIKFDYSRDGILRSIEDSLERLGMDSIDIALIHDPDDHFDQAIREAFPALDDLRSKGVVRAIGVGMNQWEMLTKFAVEANFDCFLLAGRYTLLDQSALQTLMPLCQKKTISIIIGGPYNSGILASDLSDNIMYDYGTASSQVINKAQEINTVCERYGVPLKAAALQFGLLHPIVASSVPGARSTCEITQNFEMVNHPIPKDLWDELKYENLIAQESPTL